MSGNKLTTGKPNLYGIQVMQWGGGEFNEDSLLSHLETGLQFKNNGHSSLLLTIPKDKSTKELIEKFKQKCANIPIYERRIDNLEEAYEIYFSQRFENDKIIYAPYLRDEYISWLSEYHEIDTKIQEYFSFERRYSILNGKILSLGPLVIQHQNNSLEIDIELINLKSKKQLLVSEYEAISTLSKKVNAYLAQNLHTQQQPNTENASNFVQKNDIGTFKAQNSKNTVLLIEKFGFENVDDVFSLKKHIENKMNDIGSNIWGLRDKIKLIKKDRSRNIPLYKTYSSNGIGPKLIVNLPLNLDENQTYCFDYKKILAKFEEIYSENLPYNELTGNCSTFVSNILEAGAPDEIKPYFREKILSTIYSPNTVTNSALKAQHALYNGMTWLEKITYSNFNPNRWLNKITAFGLSSFIGNKSTSKIFAAVFLFMITMPLFIVKSILSAALFPIYTIRTSLAWMSVVNNAEKSLPASLAKILINPICIINVIMSIPTACIAFPLLTIYNRISGSSKTKEDLSLTSDVQKEIQEAEKFISQNITNKYISVEAENNDPQIALNNLQTFLDNESLNEKIPYFDSDTMNNVSTYIKSIDNKDKRDRLVAILDKALKRAHEFSKNVVSDLTTYEQSKDNDTLDKSITSDKKRSMSWFNNLSNSIEFNFGKDGAIESELDSLVEKIMFSLKGHNTFNLGSIKNYQQLDYKNSEHIKFISALKEKLHDKNITLDLNGTSFKNINFLKRMI